MPLEVRILYRDGEEQRYEVPVDAWQVDGTYVLAVPGGPVRNVQIDPDGVMPDVKWWTVRTGRGLW